YKITTGGVVSTYADLGAPVNLLGVDGSGVLYFYLSSDENIYSVTDMGGGTTAIASFVDLSSYVSGSYSIDPNIIMDSNDNFIFDYTGLGGYGVKKLTPGLV